MASEVTASEGASGDGRRETEGSRSSSVAVERTRRIVAILFAVIISALIIIFRKQLAGLGAYGYPGLFLLNVVTSATIILPMPGWRWRLPPAPHSTRSWSALRWAAAPPWAS